MNRREWLKRATVAAAALAVDPERLLWEPGKRTIFIPPAPALALADPWAAVYRMWGFVLVGLPKQVALTQTDDQWDGQSEIHSRVLPAHEWRWEHEHMPNRWFVHTVADEAMAAEAERAAQWYRTPPGTLWYRTPPGTLGLVALVCDRGSHYVVGNPGPEFGGGSYESTRLA